MTCAWPDVLVRSAADVRPDRAEVDERFWMPVHGHQVCQDASRPTVAAHALRPRHRAGAHVVRYCHGRTHSPAGALRQPRAGQIPGYRPTATRLAWIAPHDGVLNVWLAPVSPQSGVDWDQAQVITADTDRGIRKFTWAHDNRHLLYLQDTGGDENWRLYDVDCPDHAAPGPDPVRRRADPARRRWSGTSPPRS